MGGAHESGPLCRRDPRFAAARARTSKRRAQGREPSDPGPPTHSPVGATETPRDGVISVAPTGLAVLGFLTQGLGPGLQFFSPCGAVGKAVSVYPILSVVIGG